jgi:cytochrome c peroxidase
MCFQCHAPHVLEYDHLVSDFIDEVKSKDPQIDGVGCSQCHLISKIDSSTRPPHPIFTPGKIIYGGYNNAVKNLAHQSQQLDLYKSSQYCVTCHDSLPQTETTAQLPGWLGPKHLVNRPTGSEPDASLITVFLGGLGKSGQRRLNWNSRLKSKGHNQ